MSLSEGQVVLGTPNYPDGRVETLALTADGSLKVALDATPTIDIGEVSIKDGSTSAQAVVSTAGADAVSNTQNELEVDSRISGFNGTTWDRIRTAVVAPTTTLTGLLNTLPVGQYNTTPPVLTNGQVAATQFDPSGNTKVTLATTIAGEDIATDVMKVEQRFSYTTVTASGTVNIKSGSGFIHTVSILGGTLGAVTVYDNTAGSGTTIIPTFTPTATFPCPSIVLDESFATGLTIVTAANTIINISYR